jgi:hypothetical protein
MRKRVSRPLQQGLGCRVINFTNVSISLPPNCDSKDGNVSERGDDVAFCKCTRHYRPKDTTSALDDGEFELFKIGQVRKGYRLQSVVVALQVLMNILV